MRLPNAGVVPYATGASVGSFVVHASVTHPGRGFTSTPEITGTVPSTLNVAVYVAGPSATSVCVRAPPSDQLTSSWSGPPSLGASWR